MGHNIICRAPLPSPTAPPAQRTLIVFTGMVRSPHLTWHTWMQRVVNSKSLGTEVDYAMAVSRTTDGTENRRANYYYRYVDYLWEMHDPPDNNFRHFFNEIAQACFGRQFLAEHARKLGEAFTPGNFLGRVKESRHPFGSSTGLFFRWLVFQKMAHLNLFERYGWVMMSRTDFLWTAPPPPVTTVSPGTLLVPKDQDWGGINDRHSVFRSCDAEKVLTVCYAFLDGSPDELIPILKAGTNVSNMPFGYNGEWFLLRFLRQHKLTIVRHPQTMFLVYDYQQPVQYFWQDFRPHLGGMVRAAPVLVIPKYHNEHQTAMDNAHFPNLG